MTFRPSPKACSRRVLVNLFSFVVLFICCAAVTPARADPPDRNFDAACDQQFANDPRTRSACKRYCERNCPEVLARGQEDSGQQCLRLRLLHFPYPCDRICGNGAVESDIGEQCDPPGSAGDCSDGESCAANCTCVALTSTPTQSPTPPSLATATPTVDPCGGRSSCDGTCLLGASTGMCIPELDNCRCCLIGDLCSTPSGPECCDVGEVCGLTACVACGEFDEPCDPFLPCCSGLDCVDGFCDE